MEIVRCEGVRFGRLDWRESCDWMVLLPDGSAVLTNNEDSSPPRVVGRDVRNRVLAAVQGQREAARVARLQREYWSTLHRFPLTLEQARRAGLSLSEKLREVWSVDILSREPLLWRD